MTEEGSVSFQEGRMTQYIIKRRVKKMSGAYREDYYAPMAMSDFWELQNPQCYKISHKFSTRNEALFVITTLDKGPEYLVEEYNQ
jgi:hypothetical protein